MRLSELALALVPSLLLASGEKLDIPVVDAIVQDVTQKYYGYIHYHAPANATNSTTSRGGSSTQSPLASGQAYWYEDMAHRGVSAFGPSGFVVYRNVKDYGARGMSRERCDCESSNLTGHCIGDGTTDDTAAINSAISAGGTCGRGCTSSSTTPAVIYFPEGTYILSSPINQAYYTQLIGNPNNPPTLKATGGFNGFGVIDADPYYTQNLNWGATNVFYRQIRNFVIDTTAVASSSSMNGIHWPTAQATSIQNVVFELSAAAGTQHVGLFIESGSAGALMDLTFNGGLKGAALGNQQYTMRNLVFNNAVTAISMFWDWSWAYKSISINNCQVGIDISAGGSSAQTVGSVTLYDSSITNTPVGVLTAWDTSSVPSTAGSLILENVVLQNVPTAVKGPSGTALAGGSMTISAWGEGHSYTPNGPATFQGSFAPNDRPASLLSGSKYYEASKPQFEDLSTSQIVSARSFGATGNGHTDDTAALQNAINSAAGAGNLFFLDAGTYLVTSTIHVPPGAKIAGEFLTSIIMSSGGFFNNEGSPQPVIQVGTPGQTGTVQMVDLIVSTQGAQAGAVLIEWNLATSGTPSGMWDVHTRIGGFTGSNLQVAQCPASAQPSAGCTAAFMSLHITKSASGLYLENNWFWTADHDIDDPSNTQISVFTGRGMLIESTSGTIWLSGTAVEHHALYQYQLSGTQDIYIAQAQTETPYYQPNPSAPAPFSVVPSLNDPNFASSCAGQGGNCADAWGFRVLNTKGVYMYGGGFYSFFDNYSTACSNTGGSENCQDNIVDVESSSDINIYNLNTVGTTNMATLNGNPIAK
ncbi:MAG: hypothetical protein LQ340_005247 [Diploschistes diacapsis]|nr:MAG: hypothetical protein LQ340_005247 [Diploschistes diacapsis]